MAEERDKLEKLIEKQKGKLKTPGEKEEVQMEQRKPTQEAPPAMPAQQPQMPQQPAQQQQPMQAPAGFSGMQTSIMDQGGAPQMPQQPAQPQQPMKQPQMPQQPAMPQQPQMPEAPEPEEIATLQEPSLPVAQLAYNRTNIEEIESLIESVVEEKWRQAMESFGDINIWKERARTEIVSIKQELLRLMQRFEGMEKAMIGKVSEYDRNVQSIGTEMKAIEKVMQKIMQPLAKNVKELERITKKLKK